MQNWRWLDSWEPPKHSATEMAHLILLSTWVPSRVLGQKSAPIELEKKIDTSPSRENYVFYVIHQVK